MAQNTEQKAPTSEPIKTQEIARVKLSLAIKFGDLELTFLDSGRFKIELIAGGPLIRISSRDRKHETTYTSLHNAIYWVLASDSRGDRR